jgi:hypothetical protein
MSAWPVVDGGTDIFKSESSMRKPFMKNTFSRAASAAATTLLIATFGVSGPTLAADQRDFGAQTCKDVMRLSGNERDLSLAFAHGYVLGQKGVTQFDVDTLAGYTDQFIDYCLDNPQANALQAFQKIAK